MKNLAALIVTTLLFAFSMSVMAGPYTLSITQPENGRISVSPVKEYYEAGDIITFTAIPDSGYTFSEFTYNGTPYLDNPLVVSPTRDMELSVEFVYSGYTIKVTPTEAGTVTIDPLKATYTKGEPVTITATPNEGAVFDGFSGTISTDESTLLIYVDQDYDLTAYFHYADYSVTVEPTEGGALVLNPDKPTYRYKEEVSYEATPYKGYRFDKIEGYLEELTEPTGSITVLSDYYLVPRFVPEEYLVTVAPTIGGTVALDPDQFLYNFGEEVNITAEPESGYEVDSIKVNGELLEGTTFFVAGPTEIEVLFSICSEEPDGFGTETEPYLIATPGNLVWMGKNTLDSFGQFYTLTQDIDLSDSANWRNGQGFPPIGTEDAPFCGTFNGMGFSIENLYISTENKGTYGLFGYASDAVIQNLTLSGSVTSYGTSALLIGNADNAQVSYVTLSGSVQGDYGAALLAGYAFGGSFQSCYSLGSAEGTQLIGGLIGKAKDASVSDCLTDVNASGESSVGGVIGEADFTTVCNCLALGSAKATEYDRGGIAGTVYESTATACFFNSKKARSNKFGTGITETQIADQATYTGWDFINIWQFEPLNANPTLRQPYYLFWTQVQGESQTKFSLSGTLNADEVLLSDNTVCLYNDADTIFVTTPSIFPSLPVKDKEQKITFNKKKGVLKYTTQNTFLTIGYKKDSAYLPFTTSNTKKNFACTITTQEDLSNTINGKNYIGLSDTAIQNSVLPTTIVTLTPKGNNLSYQDQNIKVKINTKNNKFQLKANLTTLSLLTAPDPGQQKK